MKGLPPGTILQLLYLRERLQQIKPGRFIEIGPGNGEITNLLLKNGWTGISCDLNETVIDSLMARFINEIRNNRLIVSQCDYLELDRQKVDLIISSMVIEHMEDKTELDFMKSSALNLNKDGIMIGLVPASPRHWGIEDEIAGHFRRYTRETITTLAAKTGWKILHIAGLTFPLSNALLPISNFLVRMNEINKLNLPILERTKQSGNRKVKFKTHFPASLRFVLNESVLLPFHFIQKLFTKSERSLVLYFELQPIAIENAPPENNHARVFNEE